MAKKKRICDMLEKIRKLEGSSTLSWATQRIFGKMEVFGAQVSFGKDNDYADLEEIRTALDELVYEFGGEVKWDNEDKWAKYNPEMK